MATMSFELAIPDTIAPDGVKIRTAGTQEEPLFCLADLCKVLEIGNSRDVANRLDDDEKGVGQIDTLGGRQQMTFVNESGLYSVILRSDKPQAKPFRKWVTGEVLPCIRKYGCYPAPAPAVEAVGRKREPMSLLAIRDMLDRMIDHDEQIAELAEQQAAATAKVAEVERVAQAAMDANRSNLGTYSVLGFLKLKGSQASCVEASMMGKVASRLCRQRGIPVVKIRDPRFGEVGTYPESLLEEIWQFLTDKP
jgi:prophage antirepressor-like protein